MSHDREYQIKYRKLHREKKYREKNKEKLKQYAREYKLKLKRMENTNKLIEEENKSFVKYDRVLPHSKIPFTRENYAEIKELLYQGEGTSEIHRKTGRAYSLVNAVRGSTDYENYYAMRREIANRNYAKRHGKTVPPPTKNAPKVIPEPEKEVVPTTETDAIKKILDAVDEYVAIQVELKLKEKLRKLLEE